MKIKVCGMRHADNISAVASMDIDLMGFIFFAKSPRYVSSALPSTPSHIGRVGVFVDAPMERIINIADLNSLTHIQLHGTESPEVCAALKDRGYTVIKAFQIENPDSFARCSEYNNWADMLLFDTASAGFGGSGKSFDWSWLSAYEGELPYILSGGISLDTADDISHIRDSRLWGVDLNSRFEQAPALKDTDLLNEFITKLKRH